MKKTLIALAAVAVSGAAFAQSTVQITGNMDVGLVKAGDAKGAFTHGGANSTPSLNFNVVEDLGGGMSAQGFYELNPNLVSQGTDASSKAIIGKGQAFVGLTTGFGTVRLGTPNTGLLTTQANRTPFGTALGSNYNLLGAIATTRMEGAIQYRSPAIQGFTAVIDYKPAAETTAGGATKATSIVTLTGSVAGVLLSYSNSNNQVTTAADDADDAEQTKRNDLSAQYKIDSLTLYYGYGKATGQKAVNNIAAKYDMGAISLMGNYAKQDTTKATTVGVQYNLSKRTNVYAKYNTTKTDASVKTTAIGLRHSF
jgi:predicted porin